MYIIHFYICSYRSRATPKLSAVKLERGNESRENRAVNDYRKRYNESEPMEIDRVREISKERCRRRMLCFNFKKPGHSWSQCANTAKGNNDVEIRVRSITCKKTGETVKKRYYLNN
uniref:AlNc14C425G11554 protein n=1 Tax=Albugo laibachii Nc14 TaxID=890382 RepID=F0WZF2_9STRA|nr:AlNc14C425G11554 [Albugo laibachii Nc14]|eukprot:CCA26872.1 AlNc14C425G11554 [Albugo laibachii Nc14]